MKSILKTDGLTKMIKKTAIVDGVSINIDEGDIYGFLGPNGAGKSTTIKMILGLVRPTSGTVTIMGKGLTDNSKNRLPIGAMVEYPSFYANLSGRKNLEIYACYLDVCKRRVDEVLELVNLTHDAGKSVGKYSLGMKQRLGIARAFLGNPKIVILDEPTNGLDPEGVIEIRELIRKLSSEQNTTFMISSHILSEIQNLCNKISIIKNGRILTEGNTKQLLDSSGTDNLEQFYLLTLKAG
jgi:ABC-2 type transport system ATP-binding protein